MTTSPLRLDQQAEAEGPSGILSLAGYWTYTLLGWKMLLLAALIRSIEHTFHQTDAGFGVLYFLNSLVFATAAFSGGILTERIGRRAVLVLAMLLLAAGLGGQAIAPSWLWFTAATILAGWGSGLTDGGINALFLDLYRHARGGALSFLHLFASAGALIGPVCIGLMITGGIGWRIIIAASGAAFLILVPFYARVPMPSGRHVRTDEPATIGQTERSMIPFIGLAFGIAFYVAAEMGVSNWLVQFLPAASVAVATGVLSAFWGGMALGRLISARVADRMDYYTLTVGSIVFASLSLAGAVLSPWLPLTAVLFALTGMFFGPIYPTIMALGGNIYPHRLAALGGSLTTASVAGSVIYPPLMGLMESHIGLSGGMMGAALLGIPMTAAILLTRGTARTR